MKDFTFLHDGIPKQLGNGLFNFKKLRDIVDKVGICFVVAVSMVTNVLLFSLKSWRDIKIQNIRFKLMTGFFFIVNIQ